MADYELDLGSILDDDMSTIAEVESNRTVAEIPTTLRVNDNVINDAGNVFDDGNLIDDDRASVLCLTVEAKYLRANDCLTIRGKKYIIADIQPRDFGESAIYIKPTK